MPEFRPFPLGLDNPAGRALDKQHVVGGTGIGVHFAHRHAQPFGQVDTLLVLNRPPGGFQPGVDLLAGFGFEFCVWRDQLNHSLSLSLVTDTARKSPPESGVIVAQTYWKSPTCKTVIFTQVTSRYDTVAQSVTD